MPINALNRYLGVIGEGFTAGERNFGADWADIPHTGNNKGHYLDQTSEDIGMDRGLIFPETSAQRVMRNKIPGQVGVSGDIQVPFYSKGTPTLIFYALGKNVPVEGTSYNPPGNLPSHANLDKHTITAADNSASIPSFRMAVGKDLQEHRYNGCVVRTMTIDIDPSESVLVTFGILCRDEVERDSINTADLFDGAGVDYNIKDRAVSGVELDMKMRKSGHTDTSLKSYTNVESLSIEMDNGFIDDHYAIGSQYLPNAYAQNLSVNGSLELGYDDEEDWDAIVGEDEWEVQMIGPQLIGGRKTKTSDTTASADVRQISIELPQIALKTGNLPTEGTDRYILNIDYECERKANSDDLIKVIVVNDEDHEDLER